MEENKTEFNPNGTSLIRMERIKPDLIRMKRIKPVMFYCMIKVNPVFRTISKIIFNSFYLFIYLLLKSKLQMKESFVNKTKLK